MAALHLVQEGKLSLDADVNTKLTLMEGSARATPLQARSSRCAS